MNADARVLEKKLFLSAISLYTRDDQEWVDSLAVDGRVYRLLHKENQPGGLCSHALAGARSVDPDASLGFGSMGGDGDLGEINDALDPLRLTRIELFPIANKRTNHARVSMTPHGERQIVRLDGNRAVNFDDDLGPREYRRLKALISQSRAVVFGHLPYDLSEGLIEWARHVGTLCVLCPGRSQFEGLHNLRPHVKIVNIDEARAVTGCSSDSAKTVFAEFNRRVRAEQAVIMTMGGGPVFVADRRGKCEWILPSAAAPAMKDGDFCLPVGCGDVLAGVVGLVLGHPRRLVAGELLRDAVTLGQAAATSHYYQSTAMLDTIRADYEQLVARMNRPQQRASQKQAA